MARFPLDPRISWLVHLYRVFHHAILRLFLFGSWLGNPHFHIKIASLSYTYFGGFNYSWEWYVDCICSKSLGVDLLECVLLIGDEVLQVSLVLTELRCCSLFTTFKPRSSQPRIVIKPRLTLIETVLLLDHYLIFKLLITLIYNKA